MSTVNKIASSLLAPSWTFIPVQLCSTLAALPWPTKHPCWQLQLELCEVCPCPWGKVHRKSVLQHLLSQLLTPVHKESITHAGRRARRDSTPVEFVAKAIIRLQWWKPWQHYQLAFYFTFFYCSLQHSFRNIFWYQFTGHCYDKLLFCSTDADVAASIFLGFSL